MPTTVRGGSVNTYITSTTDGTFPGDAATGHRIRNIAKWVDALAPYETPLLSSIGTGESVQVFKHEWGQSFQLPHNSNLAEDLDNVETAIDVTAGHGVRFQQYMVVLITEDTAANAEEYVWLDATFTGDTINVIRGQCGSTAVAHLNGTKVEIIGIAEPQNVNHAPTTFIYGDLDFNYPQRFGGMLQFDEFAKWEPNHEFGMGDQLAVQIERKMKDYKLLMEKSLIYGKRQEGASNSAAKRPSTAGGMRQYVTSHVTDLNGAHLSVYHIEDEMSEIWEDNGENLPKVLVCNLKTKRIINRLLDKFREVRSGDTSTQHVWDTMRFETGTVRVGVSRRIPDGEIWGLDLSQIKKRPYKGQDWQTVELPSSGSYEIKAVRGAFTFEVAAQASMFYLNGFDTNLNNYVTQFS